MLQQVCLQPEVNQTNQVQKERLAIHYSINCYITCWYLQTVILPTLTATTKHNRALKIEQQNCKVTQRPRKTKIHIHLKIKVP